MFSGHFPGRPIMRGGILEAMAQISGCWHSKPWAHGLRMDATIYLVAWTKRVRRPVVPGDKLELHSRLIAKRAMMVKFECEALVDGDLACSAQLSVVEQIAEGKWHDP